MRESVAAVRFAPLEGTGQAPRRMYGVLEKGNGMNWTSELDKDCIISFSKQLEYAERRMDFYLDGRKAQKENAIRQFIEEGNISAALMALSIQEDFWEE